MYRSTVLRSIAACVAGMLIPGIARALNVQEPISTDRPGFAFSPITVPHGALQFEVGLPLVETTDGGSTESTVVRVPVVAIRHGLLERLELRAGSALYNHASVEAGSGEVEESGHGDVELGAKVQVLEAAGRSLNLSFIGSVFLPVGDDAFTIHEDRAGFALNGAAGGALATISWITVVGANWIPLGDDEYRTNANLAAYLGRSLTERISSYVEVEWFPADDDTDPFLAGVGLALLVTPVLQLDVSVDRGLNDDATDWIIGAGVSTRFFR
jgi:hypothetical protein